MKPEEIKTLERSEEVFDRFGFFRGYEQYLIFRKNPNSKIIKVKLENYNIYDSMNVFAVYKYIGEINRLGYIGFRYEFQGVIHE